MIQSWEMASDRYREKLLELIGKIGKDDRQGKTASKVHHFVTNEHPHKLLYCNCEEGHYC